MRPAPSLLFDRERGEGPLSFRKSFAWKREVDMDGPFSKRSKKQAMR